MGERVCVCVPLWMCRRFRASLCGQKFIALFPAEFVACRSAGRAPKLGRGDVVTGYSLVAGVWYFMVCLTPVDR